MNSNILELNEIKNLHENEDIIERNLNLSTNRTTFEELELNSNNSDIKIDIPMEHSEIDGRYKQGNLYTTKRNVAEGMMDIALLTANANQLRFLITYNYDAKTFYVNMILIILSLVLQIAVGIALIFKRQMKNRGKLNKASRTNHFLVIGVFMVTIINVFVAAFTTTDSIVK